MGNVFVYELGRVSFIFEKYSLFLVTKVSTRLLRFQVSYPTQGAPALLFLFR